MGRGWTVLSRLADLVQIIGAVVSGGGAVAGAQRLLTMTYTDILGWGLLGFSVVVFGVIVLQHAQVKSTVAYKVSERDSYQAVAPHKYEVLAGHDGIRIDEGVGVAKATLYLDVVNFSQETIRVEAATFRLDTIERFSLYAPGTVEPHHHKRFETGREVNQEQKVALLARNGEVHIDGLITMSVGTERIDVPIVADGLFVRHYGRVFPVVPFFPDRENLNRVHPLAVSLRNSQRVYGLFISGQGVLREVDQALLKSKLVRALMPSPEVDALRRFQEALAEIGAMFDLRQEVFTSTLTVGRLGIETRWATDFLGVTALIGDPDSDLGWAHIEVCLPHMHPNYRPAVRLERQFHREAFDRFWKSYDAIWDASAPPDLDPPVVRSDLMEDQIRRQSAKWQAQSFSIVQSDGGIRTFTAGELLTLPKPARLQLLCIHPDLARWWWNLQ